MDLNVNAQGVAYERVVFGEFIVPDVTDTFGTFFTKEGARAATHLFAERLFSGAVIFDGEHDGVPLSDQIRVIEIFVAADTDTRFIPGSGVIGLRILTDSLWEKILDGTFNGFSIQADGKDYMVPVTMDHAGLVSGYTEPDPIDGHTHFYAAVLDAAGNIVDGNTTVDQNHQHGLTHNSHTEVGVIGGREHTHRVNIYGVGG